MKIESVLSNRHRRTVFLIAGIAAGCTVLPLLSLAGFELHMRSIEHSNSIAVKPFTEQFVSSLWPMVAFYILCGAAMGDLAARFLDHHDEIEHRKATQETIKELTVTVAHYIRNANSVIGGYSRTLISKHDPDDPVRQKLELIRKSSDQIEAVVSSLQVLDADFGVESVGTTRILMLDIKHDVQQKIRLHYSQSVLCETHAQN